MRIRSRLLLLSLAVLLPAMLGAAIGIGYVYQEQRSLNQDNLRKTARALALVLDRELQERETVLQVLGASPSLSAGDLPAFYAHAKSLVDPRYSTIILSDLEGNQLLNTRLPLQSPRPRMLPMEREFRRRFGNEPTLVSNLYHPPAGLGPPSFAVQLPVRRDGQVRFFLTMASFAHQLQEVFRQQDLPADWHASILDSDGVIVARSREPEKYVGRKVSAALLKAFETNEGSYVGTALDGTEVTAFFSRTPSYQWVFLVNVPEAVLEGAGRRAAGWLAGVTLLLLALAAVAALAVGRGIARPMESLRLAAEGLGRNEPVEPALDGVLEVDAVRAAMAQASTRLRQSSAELERKVAEAVASYETSQRALVQAQKLEALGRLTGGIAHDFNNVLQTLSTGLHAARLDAPEKVQRLLASCERAVGRGSELARQLMVFGRVQEVRIETFELARRLREAQPLLTGALPTDISFATDLPAQLGHVTADPLQLELALLNLVMNSRDAMPRGGQLRLRARALTGEAPAPELAVGDWFAVSLQDDGEGMADEVLTRAFDPFFTTKAIGRGSGMGLAQAYGFARQSGGTLVLRSRVGEGTTATMYLPHSSAHPAPGLGDEGAADSVQGRGRVLLVEDDPLVRDTVRTGLEVSGFEVRTAASADEAVRLLEAGEPADVVFTDVVMPGSMSGIELARLVLRRWPLMKVVIATGYSDRAVDVPGVRALAKPYQLQQAVAALNEALAARA